MDIARSPSKEGIRFIGYCISMASTMRILGPLISPGSDSEGTPTTSRRSRPNRTFDVLALGRRFLIAFVRLDRKAKSKVLQHILQYSRDRSAYPSCRALLEFRPGSSQQRECRTPWLRHSQAQKVPGRWRG